MSTSLRPASSERAKKISSWVRPGVFEVRASALRPVSALMREDLPTLERPAKATSRAAIGGSVSIEGEAQTNCQSPANNFRPASISFASGSVVMRSLWLYPSLRGAKRFAMTDIQVFDSDSTFFQAKVDFRLSNNSTFTPLRRMMKLCCSTDRVLFQAQ